MLRPECTGYLKVTLSGGPQDAVGVTSRYQSFARAQSRPALPFHCFSHPLRDDNRIIIEREGHRPLEPVRPRDENLHTALEHVGRDPGLVRAEGVLTASDHRRLDALAAMAGDASTYGNIHRPPLG